MKMNKIKVFADSCPTPYKLTVNAGEGTPTVITESPDRAGDLTKTYRAGILMSYRRYLDVDKLDMEDLRISDYEGGDADE